MYNRRNKTGVEQQQNVYDSTYKELSCSSSKSNCIFEPKKIRTTIKTSCTSAEKT